MHSRRSSYLGARPIALPMAEIGQYVEDVLVPRVREQIEKLLTKREDSPINDYIQVDGGTYTIPSMLGRKTVVRVFVMSQVTDRKTESLTTGAQYDPDSSTIILFLNGAYSPIDYLKRPESSIIWRNMSQCTSRGCLTYALYDILVHELTHAADVLSPIQYKKDQIRNIGIDAYYASYYNDPNEVRAYMRSIVEEAGRMATRLKDYIKGRQDLVTKSLDLSTTWRQVSPDLTPANRQKILLAVYDRLAKQGLV